MRLAADRCATRSSPVGTWRSIGYRDGVPVRVIRRVSSDNDYEYLYEGLYYVVDIRYGPSHDGPKVYQFRLRRARA